MKSDIATPAPHDLSLPDWGPYSKRFFGLSHLADSKYGHRFDLTVIPGIYRRALGVPDALRPSNYLPWSASSDLEDYSYRQQLEWKDKIYADIAFVRIHDHLRLIRCVCVNNGELNTDFAVHLSAALEPNPAEQTGIRLPADSIWLDAVLDGTVEFATPRVRDGLNWDCSRRGEERCHEAVSGSCLGLDFGMDKGDCLTVEFPRQLRSSETLHMRYRLKGALTLTMNGSTVTLYGDDSWQLAQLPLMPGAKELTLTSAGGAPIRIDGFALTPTGEAPEFPPLESCRIPNFTAGPLPNSTIVSYRGIKPHYGIWWSFNSTFVRHYAVNDYNHTLLYDDGVHQHFLKGYDQIGGKDNYLDIVLQPLSTAPGEERIIYALAADGSPEEVAELLRNAPKSSAELEAIYQERIKRCCSMPKSPWQFSQERMAAVCLSNVVYPTYVDGSYVRHHSPGRRWNCLYTWDSGFIGLGFLELDDKRAKENLQAYLTAEGDDENAFVHHGSPVPVQHYLFHELWSRCNDDAMAAQFYPGLKQYYDFMAGHAPRSFTRKRGKDAIICTWDYFYNSGGWDDYPPQQEVHHNHLQHIFPVVPTAHLIRAAKILRLAAQTLGYAEDVRHYESDIAEMSDALQKHSWDEAAGYFSYVEHDKEGNPTGFFRAPDGSNFNMGLDGASPLLAGAVTPEQRRILWEKLESPDHLWSPAGFSTVDQSASYYRTDGYWNGSVWMPYMYFFWKAALNDGRADFAWKIAKTALDIWERETESAYACYEHFHATTGRGAGWHHFSALSAPVLVFHAAYTQPEHVATGNDLLCRFQSFTQEGMTAQFVSCGEVGMPTTAIVTLPEGHDWQAECNGEHVSLIERRPGAWELTLRHAPEMNVTIRGKKQ